MDRKAYEKPQLEILGTVRELTALVADTCGSIDIDFSSDAVCETEQIDY